MKIFLTVIATLVFVFGAFGQVPIEESKKKTITSKDIEVFQKALDNLNNSKKTQECRTTFKSGNFENAIEICTQAINEDSIKEDMKSNAYYYRGKAYLQMPNPSVKTVVDGSLSKNERLAVADFKKCLEYRLWREDCHAAAGIVLSSSTNAADAKEAVEYLNESISRGNKDKELYYYRAEAKRNSYRVSENHDAEAIDDYTTFLQTNPTGDIRFDALYGRSLTYMRMRKYEKAVDDLNVLARETVDEEDVYFKRGVAYNELGRYSLALSDLNKALELHDSESQPQWDPRRRDILSGIERAKKGLGR